MSVGSVSDRHYRCACCSEGQQEEGKLEDARGRWVGAGEHCGAWRCCGAVDSGVGAGVGVEGTWRQAPLFVVGVVPEERNELRLKARGRNDLLLTSRCSAALPPAFPLPGPSCAGAKPHMTHLPPEATKHTTVAQGSGSQCRARPEAESQIPAQTTIVYSCLP